MGSGRFTAPKTIEVTSADGQKRVVRGKKVVINTGSHATIDSTPGLAEASKTVDTYRSAGAGARISGNICFWWAAVMWVWNLRRP